MTLKETIVRALDSGDEHDFSTVGLAEWIADYITQPVNDKLLDAAVHISRYVTDMKHQGRTEIPDVAVTELNNAIEQTQRALVSGKMKLSYLEQHIVQQAEQAAALLAAAAEDASTISAKDTIMASQAETIQRQADEIALERGG